MQYRKFLLGIGSLALALAMAIPSYAAKQVIPDQELDEVTAAGQPVVLISGNGGNTDGTASDIVKRPGITDASVTQIALGIEDSSQQNLRALILNNIAGENQTGNGMNIASGSSAGRQDNNITQSWGSTYDADIVKGTAVTATSSASAPGGDASCGRDALICKPVGGNASASAAASAVSTPAIRRSIYSDQVLVSDGSILYAPVTVIAMDIRDTAQQGLSALIVNNVSGMNQVANGVNISGGVSTGLPGAGNVSVNGSANGGGQGNVINQFRGTPYSRPQ
ncbi:MAG TPA: hypothetical protein VGJ57_10930 [Nitrospirales bacterium]